MRLYNKQDVLSLTRLRKFETKLGERIGTVATGANLEAALASSTARFVLVGIPEDIGVKANKGVGGANTAWVPFLQAFLNTQSNEFLSGEEVLVLGHLDFSEVNDTIEKLSVGEDEKIDAWRHAVNLIDEQVEQVAKLIAQHRKLPIFIGGGHNNAYPIIKGCAKGWHKAGVLPMAQLNCINLDAHADYRPMEGRHSGNAFRYADEDGYLEKYCVVGLHENYLQQNVWVDIVNNPFMDVVTYEDIFIREKMSFRQAVVHAIAYTDENLAGIELDLDSIQQVLSSAATPAGISVLEARQFLHLTATVGKPAYLHLCEGVCQRVDGVKDESTGKLISYLVSDFIKAMQPI
jgi:formiminoglutamase